MSHESVFLVPRPVVSDELVAVPAVEAPAPPQHPLAGDPEQARAVEALFAAQNQESDKVAGLLGMWTGAMILHDLAAETFSPEAGEVEAEEEKPKKDLS
jgi:hypothetical protein